MNKVLIVIFCVFALVSANAQNAQKEKNQQTIEDLWKRINALETSGKMSASDMETELARLKEMVKLQQDSIDKLNGILSQIKNLVNGKSGSAELNAAKGSVVIYYNTNEALADYKGNKKIDDLVEAYKANKSGKISIHGHTDNTGSTAINEKLSKKRTQTLKDYLVNKGIPADNINIQWYGSTKPAADHANVANAYLNRRVEVFIENNL